MLNSPFNLLFNLPIIQSFSISFLLHLSFLFSSLIHSFSHIFSSPLYSFPLSSPDSNITCRRSNRNITIGCAKEAPRATFVHTAHCTRTHSNDTFATAIPSKAKILRRKFAIVFRPRYFNHQFKANNTSNRLLSATNPHKLINTTGIGQVIKNKSPGNCLESHTILLGALLRQL